MTQPTPPDGPEEEPRIGVDDRAVSILNGHLRREAEFKARQHMERLIQSAKDGPMDLPLDAPPDQPR